LIAILSLSCCCSAPAYVSNFIQVLLGFLGIVSSEQMLSGWRYVTWGSCFGSSFDTSTDPLTQSLLAGAVLGLYFGGTDWLSF